MNCVQVLALELVCEIVWRFGDSGFSVWLERRKMQELALKRVSS